MKSLFVLVLLVNLNTATPEELDALPGIGPVLAGRIVLFRERRGGFRRVEELLAIPGVSEARWQVLKELVVVRETEEEEAEERAATGRSTDPKGRARSKGRR